jgi:peptidoglycan/LPS O-acetylase OafA/YrhL
MREPGSGHIAGLDGLRGLAVLSVITFHFYFAGRSTLLGALGVEFFFALSGFLITRILLTCRRLYDEGQAILPTVRRFYIRRFLRIFPLFYLVLFLATLLNIPGARQGFWWHATYTCNFYMAIHREFLGGTGHFWSLAVEEQFYLVWPTVVLFANKKWLPRIILGFISAGVVFRIAMLTSSVDAGLLPFACLDTLGLGAFMAVASSFKMQKSLSILRLIGITVGLPLLAAVMILNYIHRLQSIQEVFTGLAIGLTATHLIALCVDSASHAARILSFRPLSYLGEISYGLYVYHLPLWYFLGWEASSHSVKKSLLGFAATVIVAAASWHWFEAPINSLKRKFSYRVDTFEKKVVPA